MPFMVTDIVYLVNAREIEACHTVSMFHTCGVTDTCAISRQVPPPYVCKRLPFYWLDSFSMVMWSCSYIIRNKFMS